MATESGLESVSYETKNLVLMDRELAYEFIVYGHLDVRNHFYRLAGEDAIPVITAVAYAEMLEKAYAYHVVRRKDVPAYDAFKELVDHNSVPWRLDGYDGDPYARYAGELSKRWRRKPCNIRLWNMASASRDIMKIATHDPGLYEVPGLTVEIVHIPRSRLRR